MPCYPVISSHLHQKYCHQRHRRRHQTRLLSSSNGSPSSSWLCTWSLRWRTLCCRSSLSWRGTTRKWIATAAWARLLYWIRHRSLPLRFSAVRCSSTLRYSPSALYLFAMHRTRPRSRISTCSRSADRGDN